MAKKEMDKASIPGLLVLVREEQLKIHEQLKEVFKRLEDDYGANLAVAGNGSTDLIFKVIDEDGETMNSLSLEDSKFLRYKLEEITKDTVNRNMM